jgi:hypothetical protein
MSLKLKALGLGLLAAMAFSAVAVMNASANGAGHFVSTGNTHVEVKGFAGPGTSHNLHLVNHGLEGEIGCATQSYTATTTTETTTSITVTPAYAGCTTTSNAQAVPVDVNGCTYTFTVAAGTTNSTEQTVHLVCPTGKKIEITHPNCTVSVHPQTVNTGLTYTTTVSGSGVHEITMDVNVQFVQTRHGLCQFIAPTTGNGTLKGSVTVKGFNTAGGQVPITAT